MTLPVAELQARLSPEAQRGLEQARAWLGEVRLEQSLEGLRAPDGGYDVSRAEERFCRGAVSDEAHAERLSRRAEQAWGKAQTLFSRIEHILHQTGPEGRPGATIGDGTTEAALDLEARTGRPVGDVSHACKAREARLGLCNALASLATLRSHLTDPARCDVMDDVVRRAQGKVKRLDLAVQTWEHRGSSWPEIWHADGSSRVYTTRQGDPWPSPESR